MKQHKHAEVLRAIADGKEVQYRHSEMDRCEWTSIGCYEINPIHFPEWEWRVKPEPKPVKVIIDGETLKPKSVELIK
jgi:hypothetical protein